MTFKNSLLKDCWRACLIFTVLLGALIASTMAIAAEQQMEEVHAHVERPAEQIVGRSFTGPIVESKLQFHVRFDDLDLVSSDGVDTLRERVKTAARQACAALDKWHSNPGGDLSCIAVAKKSAQSQVDSAIAQAAFGE